LVSQLTGRLIVSPKSGWDHGVAWGSRLGGIVTAATTIGSAARAVLGSIGMVDEPSADAPTVMHRETATYLDLPVRIALAVNRIDELAVVAPELQTRLRPAVAALLNTSSDPDPAGLALLDQQVDSILDVLAQTAPLIEQAATIATPPDRLAGGPAAAARARLVAAVVRAWSPSTAALGDARTKVAELVDRVAMLQQAHRQPAKLLDEITSLRAVANYVAGMRASAGLDPNVLPPAPGDPTPPADPAHAGYVRCLNAMGLVRTNVAEWPLQVALGEDRQAAHDRWAAIDFPGTTWDIDSDAAIAAADATRKVIRRKDAYSLVLNALAVEEQLRSYLDHRPALFIKYSELALAMAPITSAAIVATLEKEPDERLSDTLDRYRETMEGIFGDLSAGLGELGDGSHEAPKLTEGAAALTKLLTSSEYIAALEAAGTRVTVYLWGRAIVIGAAIGAVVGLTGGLGAAAGGAVATALAGEAAVAGLVSWTVLGELAGEALLSTMVTRTANDIVFGPQPTDDPASFWRDVLWSVAGSVVARGATTFFTCALRPASIPYAAFRPNLWQKAGIYAGTQLTSSTFGVFQHYAQSNRLQSAGDFATSLVQQLATDALMGLARHASKPLVERITNPPPEFTTRATQVDQEAAALRELLTRVESKKATAEDIQRLSTELDRVWKAQVDAIGATLPEGVAKQQVLATYRTARAEAEIRLAIARVDTALGGTEKPMFAPAAPDTVAYRSDAQQLLESHIAERGGTIEAVPGVPGGLVGHLPDGQVIHFVPMEPLAIAPAKSATMESSANEAAVAVATNELAGDGGTVLTERFANALERVSILGIVGEKNVADFLILLADPAFQKPPAGSTDPPKITDAEIRAFAASPEARAFAEEYAPEIAARLLRAHEATTFTPEVLAALGRAKRIIDASSPATRTDLLTDLLRLSPSALDQWAGQPMSWDAPQQYEAATPTDLVGGWTTTTPNWVKRRDKLAASFAKKSIVPTQAQLDALVFVHRAIEVAGTGRLQGLSPYQKRQMLKEVARQCDLAGSLVPEPKAKLDEMARRLVVPGLQGLRFYRAGKKARYQSGATMVVARETRDGHEVNTILVSARFDEAGDAADPAAALQARLVELDAAVASAVQNVPKGERIEVLIVWYPRDKAAATAISNRLQQSPHRDRLARMGYAGDDVRTPLAEPANAVRTDSQGRVVPDTVHRLGTGRLPSNASFAGKAYTSTRRKWRKLADKYEHGVDFSPAGFPIFTPYAIAVVAFPPPGFAGNHGSDFTAARDMMRALRYPTNDPNVPAHLWGTLVDPTFVTPGTHTWHHNEDGIHMELVPTDLHDAIRHAGGVAIKKGMAQ
jgi:hypothetical protein